jgi:hypothetical protein
MASEEEQKGDSGQGLSVSNLSQDLLKDIMERCSINPSGGLIGKSEKANTNWKFWIDENDGKYHVYLPKNLESQADNWTVIVGVLAANALNAEVHESQFEFEDIGFTEAQNAYLHGIGSALKQRVNLLKLPVSGGFGAGYGWAIAQCDVVQENKKWFKTKFTSPLVFMTGSKVWNKMPGGDKNRWYSLVKKACETLSLASPIDHIVSREIREKLFRKNRWEFTNGSVFTIHERAAMADSVQNEINAYNSFMDNLANPDMNFITDFERNERKISEPLKFYDATLKSVASQRAQILYSARMKKLTNRGAYSLEDRLDLLEAHDYMVASNGTGLLLGTKRIPIILNKKDLFDLLKLRNTMLLKASSLSPDDTLGREWFDMVFRTIDNWLLEEEKENE